MNDNLILSALWATAFFVFAFILLFVWSKVYIISRKLTATNELIGRIEELATKNSQPQ
jgi:hypothetical protein